MLRKKTSKIKVWSLILCACVLLSCLPFSAFAGSGDEAACDVSDCGGYYENGFCTEDDTHYQAATLNNNGTTDVTSDDYYEISNAGQLYWFAAKVNGGDDAINAKLTANITVNPGTFDASGAYVPKDGETARIWTPMGESLFRSYHHATFDGNGKTISGLYYNGSDEYVGLFGLTGSGAKIQNLGVVNSAFVVTRQAGDGSASIGSLVGYIDAYTADVTISNCYSSSYIVGSTVDYPCHAGGLVGYVNAESGRTITLSNCYNTGSVSANSESNDISIGGLIGDSIVYGTLVVSNCYNTGSVTGTGRYVDAGGVVGYVTLYSNVVVFQACYNTGNVAAFGNTRSVGGITGDDRGNKVSATDCYYLTGTASNGVGNGTDTAIAKSSDEFASGSVAWLLNGEKADGVWKQTLTGDNKMSTPGFTGDTVYYDADSDTYYSTHNYVDGICTGCGEATEAMWGASKDSLTGSGTLAEAIAAAKNDSTIKYIQLNKSWTSTGEEIHYSIIGNGLTFDLNGKTVSGRLTLRANEGSITFTDSVGGMWENTGSGSSAVIVDDATATFTGGSYKGGNAVYVNRSSGKAVIKGGTFTSTNMYALSNSKGTVTIEGGVFSGNYGVSANKSSKLTTITGGDFSGCTNSVFYHGGVLDLSGYPTTTVAGTTPITELTVANWGDPVAVGTNVKLPTDYGFYKKDDTAQTVVTVLDTRNYYAIKSTFLHEAMWGTSKDNLTGSGTLAEAIAAAKNDSTIKYIQLNKSWTVTEGSHVYYLFNGDGLTFDLNGKTVSGPLTLRANEGSITFTDSVGGGMWDNTEGAYSAVVVDDATATFTGGSYKSSTSDSVYINIFGTVVIKGGTFTGAISNSSGTLTVEGGAFVGESGVCSISGSTTIAGGDFSGCTEAIVYCGGTLDLSGYPIATVTGTTPITELTVWNMSSNTPTVGTEVKLPDGYGFYKVGDTEQTVVTELAEEVVYAIKYTDTMTPEAKWGKDKDTLTASGTLEDAIAAAKNDTTIKYIQLNKSWTSTGDEIDYYIKGDGLTFDLNGKTVSGPLCIWASSGSVTFTDSVGGGMWESTVSGSSAVIVFEATATFTGGSYKGASAVFVNGSSGKAVIKGGTFTSSGTYPVHNSSGTVIVEGGVFVGKSGVGSGSSSVSTTIAGGDFSGCTRRSAEYWGGTLDLSGYPTTTVAGTTPLTELTVLNMSSNTPTVGTNVKLPIGYGLYKKGDTAQTIVTTLEKNIDYAIKATGGAATDDEAKWGTSKDSLTASGTLEEVIAAAKNDTTIKYIQLNKSWTDSGTDISFCLIEGGEFTLDLNGKTVSGPMAFRVSGGSVTFTDSVGGGEWENTVSGVPVVISLGGTVTFTGGSYMGSDAVYVNGSSGIVVIKGGTFTSLGANPVNNSTGTVTIEGGVFVGNFGACSGSDSVSTTITGGDFSDCLYPTIYYGGTLDLSGYPITTVAGTTPLTELTVWNALSAAITVGTEVKLPAGYGFYKKGDTEQTIVTTLAASTIYAIKSTGGTAIVDEAKWGTSKDSLTGSGTLAEAVAAAKNDSTIKYIQLNKSWTLTDTGMTYYEIYGSGLTIDLNGKTVSGKLALRANEGSITFTDSVGGGMWESTVSGSSAVIVDRATATFTGGSYKGGNAVRVNRSGGKAVIKGGTFTSTNIYALSNSSGTVTIEGGVFVGSFGACSGSDSVSTTITGGDFSGCTEAIAYWGGTLDLSGYPTTATTGTTALTELTVSNWTDAAVTVGTNIKLPAGYGFYKKGDTEQTVVTELAKSSKYRIKFVGETVSVTIAWTSMEFTYTDGAWNPEAHSYGEGTWTTSGGTVTVENVGTATVTVDLSFNSEVDGVDGSFDKADIELAANEQDTATLTLSGKPSAALSNEAIGKITVTIAKKTEDAPIVTKATHYEQNKWVVS